MGFGGGGATKEPRDTVEPGTYTTVAETPNPQRRKRKDDPTSGSLLKDEQANTGGTFG